MFEILHIVLVEIFLGTEKWSELYEHIRRDWHLIVIVIVNELLGWQSEPPHNCGEAICVGFLSIADPRQERSTYTNVFCESPPGNASPEARSIERCVQTFS